jgi:hypothetical protein
MAPEPIARASRQWRVILFSALLTILSQFAAFFMPAFNTENVSIRALLFPKWVRITKRATLMVPEKEKTA